jgi:cation:H+ antiporter
MIDLLLLAIGGAGLYYGAEWLVDGAAKLARALGVPPLVVGLTIVSYGTSMPELAVSVLAALEGNSPIAVGNVVGSNIANIGLILGTTALIAPPSVDGSLIKRDLPLLALASLAVPLVLRDSVIDRIEGGAFATCAAAYTYATFRRSKSEPRRTEHESESEGERASALPTVPRLILFIVVGLVVLLGGGKAFVEGAIGIARTLGMSDRIVGLTVVAVGTSLPELAASMVAAMKGHSELAVGNVVGSNLFNILAVLGAASIIHPIHASGAEFERDIWAMLIVLGMGIFSMRRQRTIARAEGATLLMAYVGFLSALAVLD